MVLSVAPPLSAWIPPLSTAPKFLGPLVTLSAFPAMSSDHNQPEVGLAIRRAGVQREEIFLTTKIECMGTADAAYAAIQRDLRYKMPAASGA